ncbi:MAG: alpha/beta hydrolase [Marmoricola sp.]
MDLSARFNVQHSGRLDGQPLLFVHGYGCDQNMWRHVVPHFVDDHHVVLYDQMGAGASDTSAYDPERYGSLRGYAQDLLDICASLGLEDVIVVGHSVSAMIAVLADLAEPGRIAAHVMVAPSPRYVDDPPYVGGFSESDIAEMLEAVDSNYLGWSSAIAPVIVGNPDRPELGEELAASFCRADPEIARRFARVTFLSDNRVELARVRTRTLVLQCQQDVIAPMQVGRYVHSVVPGSELVVLDAFGHCPQLSAPEETVTAIKGFLTPVNA